MSTEIRFLLAVVLMIGVLVISVVFYLLGTAVLGIDLAGLPEWAAP